MSEKANKGKRLNGSRSGRATRKSANHLSAQPALRQAAAGDVAPANSKSAIEAYVVGQATAAARGAKQTAVRDILSHPGKRNGKDDLIAAGKTLRAILEGASPDDAAAIRQMLETDSDLLAKPAPGPDEELAAEVQAPVQGAADPVPDPATPCEIAADELPEVGG